MTRDRGGQNADGSIQTSIHLVCNAHLDPVWLWEWEEGAAEAVSTFRVAADLCEEFDQFIFNHNEVILYRWVEEYDPALFKRIQRLVKEGRWHIMGGWYLQPDCNMPSGESLVRQIVLGRSYFADKFGVTPTTAINFDPFGHTRGLVQIMRKSGYDSYLFCRPDAGLCPLPRNKMIWEGYDGSRIAITRCHDGYLSQRGQARTKTENAIKAAPDGSSNIVLWGVGNHGGGPSHRDLTRLARLMADRPEVDIKHSTPEAYFAEMTRREQLPVFKSDINPFAVGCYTSQVRIKQKHRLLENELFAAEKMASAAWCQGVMAYPAAQLGDIGRDLAVSEFHDILPGSSIQAVEETSLRGMSHGLEIASKIKAHAFFALAGGQRKAKEGEIPILVYNPHPFPVQTVVECEFQLADQNGSGTFTQISVYQGKTLLPTQVEQESSNIKLDWRKRVVFRAELAPSRMNRFDCRLKIVKARPVPRQVKRSTRITVRSANLRVSINRKTGLIDQFVVCGRPLLGPGACRPLVIRDNADPWGMKVRRFRTIAGRFRVLSRKAAGEFAGLAGPIEPVRIIEDGPVRTVVEALFGYHHSFICQRYKVPKAGTEMEIETRVLWNEKDRMLKLSLPTTLRDGVPHGQVAYGHQQLPSNGDEAVAQKWLAVTSTSSNLAVTCINDGSYGSDYHAGELRLSLLRSAAYSAHPIGDKSLLPEHSFSPRIDQGERIFRFWINGGSRAERMRAIDREALTRNEKPMPLSFFPSGAGQRLKPFITLSDNAVQVTAIKKAEKGASLIIRLFEPTGKSRTTTVSLPFARTKKTFTLGKFEIKTLKVHHKKKTWVETDLMEKKIS